MNRQEYQKESGLLYGVEERVPLGKALLLGLQHVLAMDIYVVPFIIAGVLSLGIEDAAFLIQATFIGAGISTIIQAGWCMKLPIAQGPSYVPIGAVIGIAFANGGGLEGLGTAFGGVLVGAVIICVLGFTGKVKGVIRQLVPPLVGGTIIFVVGLSLMPIAIAENIYAIHGVGTLDENLLMALSSMITLIICVMLGIYIKGSGSWLRVASIIIALSVGCIVASSMGRFSMAAVEAAPWISMPRILGVSVPVYFDVSAIFTMLVIYFVLLAETTGTWFAVGAVIGREIEPEQLDKGVIGEGLGCLAGVLFGGTPVTGYSTNAGLISITGVASRVVFYACAAWMILFGVSGKLTTLIASIPAPVIGGVFVVVCAVIALSGFRVIRQFQLTERNMFIIGIPTIVTLAIFLLPKDYIATLPQYIQYMLGSSIATASIVAIVLNKVLPEGLGE